MGLWDTVRSVDNVLEDGEDVPEADGGGLLCRHGDSGLGSPCSPLQVPGAGTRVGRRAVRLPGEKRSLDAKGGQEVLQTDHLGAGLLPQPLHLVRTQQA